MLTEDAKLLKAVEQKEMARNKRIAEERKRRRLMEEDDVDLFRSETTKPQKTKKTKK